MARSSRELTPEYTSDALRDLDAIWDWNAERYGVDHANAYLARLRQGVLQLTLSPDLGVPVPGRDDYRYKLLKRRRKGHGHLVVYLIDGNALRVLRFFHTAQNWPAQVESDSPE